MEYRNFKKGKERNGDTAILIQISNCDGVLLEIYFGSQIPVTTGQFELRGFLKDMQCPQNVKAYKKALG